MKANMSIALTVLAVVLVGVFFPALAESEEPDYYETGVANTHVEYFLTNSDTNGGSSSQAPDYHDIVLDDMKSVTFHNYVNIHDERLQSTEYYVVLTIEVFERIGEVSYKIVGEDTHHFYYSPPYEFHDIHYISIDVEMNGSEFHLYEVRSTYTWYKENSDGELEKMDFQPKLSEYARVYESKELIDKITPITL